MEYVLTIVVSLVVFWLIGKVRQAIRRRSQDRSAAPGNGARAAGSAPPAGSRPSAGRSAPQSSAGSTRQNGANTGPRPAESGADGPGPLIRRATELFDSNDLSGAVEVYEEAYRRFPDHRDVIYGYAALLQIRLHVEERVVGTDYPLSYRDTCGRLLELCSKLGAYGKAPEFRSYAYYQLGKFYFLSPHRNLETALSMFRQTDAAAYPYAVVAAAHIHTMDTGRYGRELHRDARLLRQTLGSTKWENNVQKAAAYFILSLIYSIGAPHVSRDVNYAYSCIRTCASLDPEMAAGEIGKYREGPFGITYSG